MKITDEQLKDALNGDHKTKCAHEQVRIGKWGQVVCMRCGKVLSVKTWQVTRSAHND